MSERLYAIEQRLKNATPAPWEVRGMHGQFHSAVVFHGRHERNVSIIQWLNGLNQPNDVDLVINAPSDLAALLAVAKAAKAVRDNFGEFDTITDGELMDDLYEALAALDSQPPVSSGEAS